MLDGLDILKRRARDLESEIIVCKYLLICCLEFVLGKVASGNLSSSQMVLLQFVVSNCFICLNVN